MAELNLGNLKLSYPNLTQNDLVYPLIERLKARRARRRSSRDSNGRIRGRDAQLADELAVMRFLKDLETARYTRQKDLVEGRREDRRFALDLSKEDRLRREELAKQIRHTVEQEKDFVFKWIELWNKAGAQDNVALQENLAQSFDKNYLGSLSPGMRRLVEPILRQGPFSPSAKKAEMFRRTNPEPKVTADPTTDPLAWAKQMTGLLNWRADLTGVVSGKRPEVPTLVGIGEGSYLSTKNGGQIVTEQGLKLEAMAAKANVPVMSLITNGGYYGKQRTVRANGQVYTVANFTDLDGQTYVKTLGSEPDPANKELFQFMKEWATWEDLEDDQKEKLAGSSIMPLIEVELEKSKKRLKKSKQIKPRGDMSLDETIMSLAWDDVSQRILRPRFGYNFILHGYKEEPGAELLDWNFFTSGEQGTLTPVPGDLTTIENARVYYDSQNDVAYDSFTGARIGTRQETEQIAKKQKAQRAAALEEPKPTDAGSVISLVKTKLGGLLEEQEKALSGFQPPGVTQSDNDFNRIYEMIRTYPED